jgi:HK97 family phage major capsid protein
VDAIELKSEIEKLGQEIDSKITKGLHEGQRLHSDTKTELSNMTAKMAELQADLDKKNADIARKMQDQYEDFQTEFKKSQVSVQESNERFADVLKRTLASEDVKSRLQARKKSGKIDFSLNFAAENDGGRNTIVTKTVGDMTRVNAVSGSGFGVIDPFRRGLVADPAYPSNHVRDYLTVLSTDSPVIHYVRENGGEGSPGMVAEGVAKPQIDFDLSDQIANVRKVACYLVLSEEMIEDIPYITNYVTTRGAEKLRRVEDNQILYGDGDGQNLTGLTIGATAFAAGSLIIPTPQRLDVIRAAMAQIRVAYYQASAIMLNPLDVAAMELTKDDNKNYMFRDVQSSGVRTIWGLPIVENDTITAGSFFLGDFRNGAELFDRKALNIRFYDQDRDNAITNKVTIVIEERLALANIRPAAFVKGTFSAAITDLTS